MTLGIFLSMGDSFQDMEKSGRASQFRQFYLKAFSKSFERIYIFSYANEAVKNLPKNVQVIPNKYNLHRFLYGLAMPFINYRQITKTDVFRVYHLQGTLPAIVTKLFFGKPFIFNWAYDYKKFARIEKKYLQLILIFVQEPLAKIYSSKIFVANNPDPKDPKVVYLPNGVDINFYKPQADFTGGFKNKKPQILSVGRLEKQKNYENLIRAIAGINASLILVGQGSLRGKLIGLAGEQNVDLKIIDRVENTRMPYIYNSADIFVLPSIIEGSPKALLEAMSCQLPVIGTRVEGIKNLLQTNENGLLVNPTKGDITQAISRLLNDPKLREKLAKKAREFIVAEHNLSLLIKSEVSAILSL